MPKKIELTRGIDAWSGVHLLGCFFLCSLSFISWRQALALGIIWEGLDFIYACFRLELPDWVSSIFDPRGADIMDIVMDAIGVGLFVLLNYYHLVG